jgi:hypothetical protein
MWLTFGPSHQLASSNELESIWIHRLHPSKTLKSIWHTQEAHIKQFKRNRVCKWRERERERERGVLRQVTIACNVLVHGFRYKSQAGLLIINLQKI